MGYNVPTRLQGILSRPTIHYPRLCIWKPRLSLLLTESRTVKRQHDDVDCYTDGLGVMLILRVRAFLGREEVQGGPFCPPLSLLSISISFGQRSININFTVK